MAEQIALGFCQCGCGQKTSLARQGYTRINQRAGEPVRYIVGHSRIKKRANPYTCVVEGENCVALPLATGEFTIVDADKYKELSQYRWGLDSAKKYVVRTVTVDGRHRTRWMHRELLGLVTGDRHQGEHKNRNSLDNRISNLRTATNSQNRANIAVQSNNRLGMKGVSPIGYGRFRARIRVNKQLLHLGCFGTAEEAQQAYFQAAQEYFGEFARI